MNKLALLTVICIIGLSSCNKEEKYKERLDGKWSYEKAKWQEKTFKRTDILDEYKNFDVYFTDEGSFQMINEIDSVYLIGSYILEQDTDVGVAIDGSPAVASNYEMAVSYEDTVSKKQYLEIWNVARISKSKFRYETKRDGKNAYFTLKKQ